MQKITKKLVIWSASIKLSKSKHVQHLRFMESAFPAIYTNRAQSMTEGDLPCGEITVLWVCFLSVWIVYSPKNIKHMLYEKHSLTYIYIWHIYIYMHMYHGGNRLSTALSGPGGGKLCVLSTGFSDARVTNLGRPRAGDKRQVGKSCCGGAGDARFD